ncbi:MAG: hypothetical protein J6Q54_06660 [Oscillospiraceae bacterium]|nr:hypothetical protein [Oscillospiraceae bacterium]
MAQNVDVQYVSFYATGSSALKVTPVVPLKTEVLPKQRKVKKLTLFIDPMAVAAISLALVMSILLGVGITELNNVRQEEANMASYLNILQTENVTLQEAYAQGLDLQMIEDNALALGMIPAEEAQQREIRLNAGDVNP